MTPHDFDNKIKEWLAEEKDNPESLWYLSFADKKFNGAVIVMAKGFVHAHMKISVMGLNLGGSVKGVPFPDHAWPDQKWWNRVLSKKDIQNMDEEFKRSIN